MNRGRLALLFILAAACSEGAPRPAAFDPVTTPEAEAMARDFLAAVEPCDPEAVGALLDIDTVVRRAIHAADLKKAEEEHAYKGMISVKSTIPTALCQGFSQGFDFEFLRTRDVGGRPTPQFRGLSPTGLNYYELELGKSKRDQKVRIIDIYVYVTGERLSDTFAKLVHDGVGVIRAGGNPRMLEDVNAAHRRGDTAEARRLIGQLPARLRNGKQIRLMELQMVDVEDPDYLRLIEEFEKAFPDDRRSTWSRSTASSCARTSPAR